MGFRRAFACILACAGVFLAPIGGHAADRGETAGQQFAYLQKKNIFRAGLRGTHTIALTFDDGPNESTRRVLAALDAYGVKATFFIVGGMAKAHPDLLAEIAEAGHLLGNHSATHSKFGDQYLKNPKLLIRQLRQVSDYIAPLMGPADTLFFRAPYGVWRPGHAKVLNSNPVLKHYVGPIYWDIGGETRVDSQGYVRTSADWDCWHRGWKAATCAKGYLREIEAKDGGVVIMHAIHPKSGALVEAVVPVLQREGFKFVRLDEVKGYDKYKTPPREFRPSIAMADMPIRR